MSILNTLEKPLVTRFCNFFRYRIKGMQLVCEYSPKKEDYEKCIDDDRFGFILYFAVCPAC
jgi:hypothetical protein